MRNSLRGFSVGLAAVVLMSASLASAGTLDDVRKRGHLICGINTGLVGFAAPDDKGVWKGFDVDVCRAVAAAVFGDANKLKYKHLTGKTRFTALRSAEIDMLSRNTTWTFSRDVDLQLTFVGVNYYDGQGFMAPKKLGVKSAKDLAGASVCIQTGTTTELNLADYFRANNMKYEPVPIETNTEARTNYLAGRCDVYTTDRSGLAATRAATDNPDAHVVLPEIISKEPLGPLVRHGDDQWADIVRWSLNAMIAAEEMGVSSKNVKAMASKENKNKEVNRLLGVEELQGRERLGLSKDWAVNVIAQVGNYGEVFEAHLGTKTPIGLARGLNAQWTDGGLLYAPPFPVERDGLHNIVSRMEPVSAWTRHRHSIRRTPYGYSVSRTGSQEPRSRRTATTRGQAAARDLLQTGGIRTSLPMNFLARNSSCAWPMSLSGNVFATIGRISPRSM